MMITEPLQILPGSYTITSTRSMPGQRLNTREHTVHDGISASRQTQHSNRSHQGVRGPLRGRHAAKGATHIWDVVLDDHLYRLVRCPGVRLTRTAQVSGNDQQGMMQRLVAHRQMLAVMVGVTTSAITHTTSSKARPCYAELQQ